MNSTVDDDAAQQKDRWWRAHSELGICALLFVVGVLVLTDTLSMPADFEQRGPVGPKAIPTVVGSLLVLVSVLLTVNVLRGGRGEAEASEDVDATGTIDWRTVGLLAGVFLANAALINVVGFPISSAILFWGAAYALGSRNMVRDPLIAATVAVVTWIVFNELLGVPLPGGPLMGAF